MSPDISEKVTDRIRIILLGFGALVSAFGGVTALYQLDYAVAGMFGIIATGFAFTAWMVRETAFRGGVA